MFLWYPVLDLARAPRRTARKKGSGYENALNFARRFYFRPIFRWHNKSTKLQDLLTTILQYCWCSSLNTHFIEQT